MPFFIYLENTRSLLFLLAQGTTKLERETITAKSLLKKLAHQPFLLRCMKEGIKP